MKIQGRDLSAESLHLGEVATLIVFLFLVLFVSTLTRSLGAGESPGPGLIFLLFISTTGGSGGFWRRRHMVSCR
jgi:hypothetical protein